MSIRHVSIADLCFFDLDCGSVTWFAGGGDQEEGAAVPPKEAPRQVTPHTSPATTRRQQSTSSVHSLISRGSSISSLGEPSTLGPNESACYTGLDELADRFRETQQILLRDSEDAYRKNQQKADLLRNAMIATMLASPDSALAQAGKDALQNNSPVVVNPYQILQVRRDATPSEIRHAYRRLALWHHPGRCCGGTTTPEERNRRLQIFEILAASYETLLDKETRSRCDHLLKERHEEQGRSKNIPAGQVNVGGRPLLASAKSSVAEDASDNFVARVIGRLAVRRMGSSFDNAEELSATQGLPTVEPVSSDSSLDDAGANDDSSCESVGPMSPRIHMPLGTPIGTPQRNTADHVVAVGKGAPAQPPAGFLSFNCGMNTMNSFDSQPIPPLINSSSSVELAAQPTNKGGEIHYTEGETNRLFGGPLQLLFRARRWKSFRDPLAVFAEVFGSDVPLGNLPTEGASTGSAVRLPPNTSTSAAWTGSSETLKDGTVLFKTSRLLHNRRMTRTEAVWVDPLTGQRHSKVTVTSESLEEAAPEPGPAAENVDEEALSGWTVCGHEWTLCDCRKVDSSDDAAPEGMFCGAACSWF